MAKELIIEKGRYTPDEGGRTQPPSRTGTKQIAGHFPADVAQALRIISAEQNLSMQDLLAESINLIFEKYGKAARAPLKPRN